VSGNSTEAAERRRLAGLLDLAFDRRPEQLEDLGDDDHRRRAVAADRLEDDARVSAPDVEDVGADIEGVEQGHGLLEEVRQRQQRDDAMLHRRDDAVHRPDRRDDVVVGKDHALRRAGRARREGELDDVGIGRPPPGVELLLPIGREGLVGLGG
jgi:hypothetical protein